MTVVETFRNYKKLFIWFYTSIFGVHRHVGVRLIPTRVKLPHIVIPKVITEVRQSCHCTVLLWVYIYNSTCYRFQLKLWILEIFRTLTLWESVFDFYAPLTIQWSRHHPVGIITNLYGKGRPRYVLRVTQVVLTVSKTYTRLDDEPSLRHNTCSGLVYWKSQVDRESRYSGPWD